jgi:peroxiredoxin family protein
MTTMAVLLQEATLNKFVSLGTLVSGAIVFDMEVHIFVMDEAVWAFRKDRYMDLKVDTSIPGYEEALLNGINKGIVKVWHEQLAELKESGMVTIKLCQLCCAIGDLEKDAFLDIVDKVAGIGTFIDDIYGADKIVCL